MNTTEKIPWRIEADYVQACSCDYGCPCEFQAPPSRGFCEGVGFWNIHNGRYGKISLDGLGMGMVLHSPEEMHKGNITVGHLFDQRASSEQRDALFQIISGKAGGMPFEILSNIVSKVLPPQFVPFEFKLDGRVGSVNAGDNVRIAVEPIRNPVTGDPEQVRVEHGTGFMFQSAEVVSASECRSSMPSLSFSWPNKAGFVSRVRYSSETPGAAKPTTV